MTNNPGLNCISCHVKAKNARHSVRLKVENTTDTTCNCSVNVRELHNCQAALLTGLVGVPFMCRGWRFCCPALPSLSLPKCVV